MFCIGLEEARICILREFAAVDIDSQLDLGLVGITGEGRRADGGLRTHWLYVWFLWFWLAPCVDQELEKKEICSGKMWQRVYSR